MSSSSSEPILRKPAKELTLDDINFILSVTIESLKTAHNSLSLLKDVAPALPLSSWVKREKGTRAKAARQI
jgi:hypothetical protein